MENKNVLVLDPISKFLYKYDLETHENEYLDSENLSETIEKEVNQLNNLKGFDLTGWSYHSPESKKYQTRALWPHLTKSYTSQYPVYTTSRELSSAFSNVTDIKIRVDAGDYISESHSENLSSAGKAKSESAKSKNINIEDNTLIFKACLVNTVSEAIKLMVRKAYKEFRIKIHPKDLENNNFAFKVKGRREYLTGNFPLLAFRYVRTILRGDQVLSVNLIEVPKNHMDLNKHFLSEDEDISARKDFLIFQPATSEEKYNSQVLLRPRIFQLNSLNPGKKRKTANINLLTGKYEQRVYDRISAGHSELKFYSIENFAFTGECDWPFRAKICGVDSLYKVFLEAFKGTATSNGTETPEYLLMPKAKSKESHHGRRSTANKLEVRENTPNLAKSAKIQMKSIKSVPFSKMSAYINQSSSCTIPYELAIDYTLPAVPSYLSFDAMLLYGDTVIKDSLKRTEYTPFTYSARLMEWLTFPLKISELPKETRFGINIYAVSQKGHSFLIGSCTITLFDEFGNLRTGLQEMNIWPFYRVEGRLSCMQNFNGELVDSLKRLRSRLEYSRIYVMFEEFIQKEVVWSLKDYSYLNLMYKSLAKPYRSSNITIRNKSLMGDKHMSMIVPSLKDSVIDEEKKLQESRPQIEQLAYLDRILMADPIEDLGEEEKKILFICRNHYKSLPFALPLFLKSVDWTRPLQVKEAYEVLSVWSLMKPEDALALLNADYPDENVRLYAVRRVNQLSDEDLAMYSPQLIQCLSFECNHFSVLGEMLLERSLKNPFLVGHAIYWGLRSQLHIKATAERFGLFLEQFVSLCGEYRNELMNELTMVKNLTSMGNILAEKPKYEQRREYLPSVIKQFVSHFDQPCTLPINSTMEVKSFDGGKCRIMKSKKMPLFMSMLNSEIPSEYIQIIFKDGDDLRQDIITLQMITVMDTIWLESGLDLRMKPYLVVATGDQSGMIEIVMNSKTTADIHNLHGKFGALLENTLRDYILQKNGEDEEKTEKAFDNFVRSCAGYCVATYVLGIGDRHNGNIMLTNNGHLFHIDFGHFLGNFKSKFGIKRERSGFVLTQEMAYVMDGKDGFRFQIFKDYCCKAFNHVRKHGKRLINLFLLMISAGMPELKNKEDINYLKEMLSLNLTEKEADAKFIEEIDNSLNNYFRSIDNAIHVWR